MRGDQNGNRIPDWMENDQANDNDQNNNNIPDWLEPDTEADPQATDPADEPTGETNDAVAEEFLQDSNDNGIVDGWEDLDGDGVPDSLVADTDGDGIPDAFEDSDGDGTPDLEEAANPRPQDGGGGG